MKSWKMLIWGIMLVPLMAGTKSVAQEQDLGSPNDGPWLFSTRAGGEFSDNRDGVKNGKESNLDLFIEPRADYRFRDGNRTVLDLAVLPMVKWHSNPRDNSQGAGQNDTELFGTAMAELSHQLTPRLLLSIGDAITYNDDPEVNNGGGNVRASNNHIWNDAHANVEYALTEQLAGDVGGNYSLKRYSDSAVAANEDEDIFEGHADLKYKMGAGYKLIGNVGASKFENNSVTVGDRGSSVLAVGGGVEKTFNPDLIGKVMAGYQHGEYENKSLKAIDTPNGSVELTMRAASETRFRVGGSYGLYAPYVQPYSIQTLTAINAGVDHDVLSKRLTVSLNGQYGNGHYKAEGVNKGGDDTMVMVGVRADYRVNRNWSLEGGYSLENWDSDVRESFTRNLVDFGVKVQL